MPDEPLYLAIDQGGHATRALLYDGFGEVHDESRVPIETLRPTRDRVEHDPEELLVSVRTVCEKVLRDPSVSARIKAAGLAVQRSSVVAWRRSTGEALSPVLSWQDRRGAAFMDEFGEEGEAICAITGLVPSPHYGASKLRWLLDNVPEIQAAHGDRDLAMGPLSSFLTSCLLENHPVLADPANGSRTLLWSRRDGDWSDHLLALFGIPQDVLPDAVSTRHDFGNLIGFDIPVTIVTGDQSAAVYAWGVPATGTIFANLGTGGFLQQFTGKQTERQPGLLSSVVYGDDSGSKHVLEGTVNGCGSALTTVAGEVGVPGDDLRARLAEHLPSCTAPPLFLNGVGGLGAPFWIPDFSSRFIGEGSAWEKLAAVVESIVFLLGTNLQARPPTLAAGGSIIVTGGWASLDDLCRMLANVTGVTVVRPRAAEATARGVAFLVSRSAGWPSTTDGDLFQPQKNPSLIGRYRRWSAAMTSAIGRNTPQVIAHRGFAAAYPENTLESIKAAARGGAGHIEIDIQISRDGVPVVHHDENLERTAGLDLKIADLDADHLSRINVSMKTKFGSRFESARLPMLADVVGMMASFPDVSLFVEIKRHSISRLGAAGAVEALLGELEPISSRVAIISFDENAVREARRLGAAGVGWVLRRWGTGALAAASALKPDYLFADQRIIPPPVFKRGLPDGPWRWAIYEVTDPAIAMDLGKMGADFVETMAIDKLLGDPRIGGGAGNLER